MCLKLSAPDKENHKAMWMWLSKHPNMDKVDWPGFKTIGKYGIKFPRAKCFLCEQFFNPGNVNPCERCPLDKLPGGYCFNWYSIFKSWLYAGQIKDRKKYAKQIANCWR